MSAQEMPLLAGGHDRRVGVDRAVHAQRHVAGVQPSGLAAGDREASAENAVTTESLCTITGVTVPVVTIPVIVNGREGRAGRERDGAVRARHDLADSVAGRPSRRRSRRRGRRRRGSVSVTVMANVSSGPACTPTTTVYDTGSPGASVGLV